MVSNQVKWTGRYLPILSVFVTASAYVPYLARFPLLTCLVRWWVLNTMSPADNIFSCPHLQFTISRCHILSAWVDVLCLPKRFHYETIWCHGPYFVLLSPSKACWEFCAGGRDIFLMLWPQKADNMLLLGIFQCSSLVFSVVFLKAQLKNVLLGTAVVLWI